MAVPGTRQLQLPLLELCTNNCFPLAWGAQSGFMMAVILLAILLSLAVIAAEQGLSIQLVVGPTTAAQRSP